MQCPKCGHDDTKVIDSRMSGVGEAIRRRRKCDQCDFRFTTYERMQVQLPMIVKNDGRREHFNRDKILKGLTKATQKRPVSVDQLEALINSIEQTLVDKYSDEEIPAHEIGELIMTNLRQLDPVSFVRFASFYWDYQNIQDFVRTLKRDHPKDPKAPRPQKDAESLQ